MDNGQWIMDNGGCGASAAMRLVFLSGLSFLFLTIKIGFAKLPTSH
jgi:hypothetical protein